MFMTFSIPLTLSMATQAELVTVFYSLPNSHVRHITLNLVLLHNSETQIGHHKVFFSFKSNVETPGIRSDFRPNCQLCHCRFCVRGLQ